VADIAYRLLIPMRPPLHPHRSGRTIAAVVAFLSGFLILLLAVSHYYLLPAADAARSATKPATARLAAEAVLVLTLLLTILLAGLVLAFRPSRFFRPRNAEPRTRTTYVDAWAEAGRRAEAKDDEQE